MRTVEAAEGEGSPLPPPSLSGVSSDLTSARGRQLLNQPTDQPVRVVSSEIQPINLYRFLLYKGKK